MGYSPDEFYRMSLNDIFIMIEAFGANEMAAMNRLRHNMWASLSAFGGSKITPHKLMPLPMDGDDTRPVSKEEFLKIAAKMAALDKQRMAKA